MPANATIGPPKSGPAIVATVAEALAIDSPRRR